jgi:hypothetical protein
MYTYKFSDSESDEIVKKAKDYNNLEELFKQVDKKYNSSQVINEEDYNKKLDLQRKTTETKSQDDVLNQAQNEIYEYKTAQENAIENDYTKKSENIDNQLENLSLASTQSKKALEGALDKAKTDASNDAIKRGLARSSIIVNKLASYDQTYLKEFATIEKGFLNSQNKLNNERGILEVQRQNALDAFDISYAVSLSEKINSINEKLLKQEKEVIEYNNKLEEIEKEFELKQAENLNKAKLDASKQNQDYAKYIGSGGGLQIDMVKEQEKFDIAYDYLSSLPKAQALYELTNNNYFENHLKLRYKTLLSQMQARKD